MPYLWLPWLQGDVTVKGRTGSLYVNPFEMLEHLERAPWMSYIEARNGPFILYNDTFYAKLGVDLSRERDLGRVTVDATLRSDFSEGVIETGAAYEIAKWRSGTGGSLKDGYAFDRYTAIDLLAGARYWQQDMNVNFVLTGTLDTEGLVVSGSRAFARSGVVDWVDPLVGFRIRQMFAPGQELMFRADVGGFDVGSFRTAVECRQKHSPPGTSGACTRKLHPRHAALGWRGRHWQLTSDASYRGAGPLPRRDSRLLRGESRRLPHNPLFRRCRNRRFRR
jgi:hypothetical protein